MWIHYQGKQYSVDAFIDAFDDISPLEESVAFLLSWPQGPFQFQTSGSTGSPKAFIASRPQMLASIANTAEAFDLHAGMTVLMPFHPRFVASKMIFARAMALDLNVVVVDSSKNPLSDDLPSLDFASFVPYQLQSILEESPETLDNISTILLGGAPISPELEIACSSIAPRVYHGFGMTETLSHVAIRPVNGEEATDTYKAVGDNTFQVNEEGCIQIKGQVTNGEWLGTNDRIQLLDSTHFRWLGRNDWVINTGGVKVSPEEVEREIHSIPAFHHREFVISSRPSSDLGQEIVLVVQGSEKVMHEFDQLQRFHRPKEIIYVDQLPRNDAGKIDRRKVSDLI